MTNTVSVTGWRMVGSAYRNGLRLPGFTQLMLSDGRTRYYPEDVAIGPALERERIEHGTDVSQAQREIAAWINGDLPNLVNFDLR